MSKTTKELLPNLWVSNNVQNFPHDQIELLIYRSNILGSDLRVTNYGGGNTSCKTTEKDPLTNEEVEVLWVKGSGGDIGTMKRNGLAGLYLKRLHDLKKVYRGLAHEDEMVSLFNHCLFDLDSKAPSIDTPLHAFLPYKHIDHVHADAVIAIAAAEDGEKIMKDVYGDTMAWIPWQRPGFDLALKLEEAIAKNPNLEGLILGSHGLFTWGDTSEECYNNTIDKINKAVAYIDAKSDLIDNFGGQVTDALNPSDRKTKAAEAAPVLRGFCSEHQTMIGHFTDSETVLEFINSKNLEKLAPMGTSCPDHFLRTKIKPLILDIDANYEEWKQEYNEIIKAQFESYREDYTKYYENHKHSDSPAMRDPNPVVILWPGVGMFTFAKNKQTARVASEFYINAINVMRGSEAISSYTSLPLQEAFNIEYWQLEEAKLRRLPPEKSLSRKVALVTGAAGGIGKAIANKLAAEGACVVLTDINSNDLGRTGNDFGKDEAITSLMNVKDVRSIEESFNAATLAFGGVDIIVNCAGLAISKPIEETSEADFDALYDVIVKGQFLVTQEGLKILRKQKTGGDIVNIASKNGLVSGANNAGYGSAKSAQIHMSRLMAAELGKEGIRVNVVNPDAVIEGSKIWEGKWAQGRAKAYGISVEDLPNHYAKRTLLNEIIRSEDIANGVFAFIGGNLSKSTGNILNVDGGIPGAFVR